MTNRALCLHVTRDSLCISPCRPSSWYTNIAHYMGVYVLDIAIDPQPASGSCLSPLPSSSPPRRWLVTNGAVNYSGWARIRYERGGTSERKSGGGCTNTHSNQTYPHMMIVSSYARQLYILVLLPLLHLQIVLSINPISCLPFFLFFFTFYVCRCTCSTQLIIKAGKEHFHSSSDSRQHVFGKRCYFLSKYVNFPYNKWQKMRRYMQYLPILPVRITLFNSFSRIGC